MSTTIRLKDEHQRIEALCADLLNRVHAGDPAIIDDGFRGVDRLLREHLAFEEEEVLPALARVHPEIAQWVRADHDRIRDGLDEVGVAIQCHLLREDHARDVVALVTEHIAHEERTLLPWVEAHEGGPDPWRPPSSGPPVA